MMKINVVNVLVLSLAVVVLLVSLFYPEGGDHHVAFSTGWLFSLILFLPVTLLLRKATLPLFMVVTSLRMVVLIAILFIVSKFMDKWLFPFAVAILSTFPFFLVFEVRTIFTSLAGNKA